MARMIAEVYQALRSAGAPESEARAAATAVAETDREIAELKSDVKLLKYDVKLLKYMVGVNTGLLLIVLGKLFLPGT